MPRYNAVAGAAISLSAGVAKTVLAITTPSTRRVRLVAAQFGFNSVTSSDTSVLVQLVRSDGTSAGTSTSVTPVALDPAEPAALCTSARDYSAEPTVLTVIDELRVTPVGGTIILPYDFLAQAVAPVSRVIGIRMNCAQAQTGVRGSLTFDE